MSTNTLNKAPVLQFSSFRELETLFGPPPVLQGEDADAYRAIGQAIWDARPPEDFIQATRINDIAYLLWEGGRMRRLKVKLIEASKIEGAKSLIRRLTGSSQDQSFWAEWAAGEKEHVDYVNSLLTGAGLTEDAIIAQTIDAIIETLETIERQSAQFEARRIVTIKEYDQYTDNAESRRALAEERRKQISDKRTKKSKAQKEQDAQSAPQLPLDLEAAE